MLIFSQNLDRKGRIIRGAGAILLAIGALSVVSHSLLAAVALGISSAFLAFEALRGWCALRACGVKTKF